MFALFVSPALATGSFLTDDQMQQFSQSIAGKDCQDPMVIQSAQLMHMDDPGAWSQQMVNPKTPRTRFMLQIPASTQWSVLGKSLYPTQWTKNGISVGLPKFFKDAGNPSAGCTFERSYRITSAVDTLEKAIQRSRKDRQKVQAGAALPVIMLHAGQWQGALIPSVTPMGEGYLMNYDTLSVEAGNLVIQFSRPDHRLDGNMFRMAESIKR